MKKVACLLLVGALGLFGCGGGGDDDDDIIVFPDAGTDANQTDGGGNCNAVSQTGCLEGQKCSWIVDVLGTDTTDEVGHVGCIAEGPDAVGAACTDALVIGDADSCAKPGYCYNGTCRKICSTVNDLCEGECGQFVISEGNPFPFGWCLDACDPLLQDCPTDNESCFLGDNERGGVCLGHREIAVGVECTFTNDCAEGGQCLGREGEPSVCRALCGTITQIWYIDESTEPPTLGFPTCCGVNCTGATLACPGTNTMCWLIGDGVGGILDIGFCQTDDESSSSTAEMPYTCNCLGTPDPTTGELCALD